MEDGREALGGNFEFVELGGNGGAGPKEEDEDEFDLGVQLMNTARTVYKSKN